MINKKAIPLLTPQFITQYQINTNIRKAMFFAQCHVESGGFTQLRENMNYSAEQLMKTFKEFKNNPQLAAQYARQPQKIGNFVYGNEYGNGSSESGEGYYFRGFGWIQLTFKDQWLQFQKDTDIILIDKPQNLNQENATLVSLWYWQKNKINACEGNVFAATRIINRYTDSLPQRQQMYNEYLAYFNNMDQ